MSRFIGNAGRRKLAAAARRGAHYAALNAPAKPKKSFETGDIVRNTKTGKTHEVTRRESWGDYALEDESGYFPPDILELVKKGSP